MLQISQLADILILIAFFIPAFTSTENVFVTRRQPEEELTIGEIGKSISSLVNFICLAVLFRFTSQHPSVLPDFIVSLIASVAIVAASIGILLLIAFYLEKRDDIGTWRHLAIFAGAIVLITLLILL